MTLHGVKLTDWPGKKIDILRTAFSTALEDDDVKLAGYQPYFDYYTEEIGLLYAGLSDETRQINMLPALSADDILQVITFLSQNLDRRKSEIREGLAKKFPRADLIQLDRLINLAIRLWLMINTQDVEFQTLRNEATCVSWNDDIPLRSFTESLFPVARWDLNPSTSRLGPYFTAAFMHRVCGLKLEWTTSIHDHLHLDHSRNTLRVFGFKCHVQGLLARHKSGLPSAIPVHVLQETLLSLDLLFPFWDKDTGTLLKHEGQIFHTHGPFTPRAVSLLDFDHWRDRLLELQEVLQSPPVSWAQLWRDRRNPQQFWTFWIALVILVLTIISAAASCVQAWASVQALYSNG